LAWELGNCDEFRAFMKTVIAYIDGAPVAVPQEIVSDWPAEDQNGKGARSGKGVRGAEKVSRTVRGA